MDATDRQLSDLGTILAPMAKKQGSLPFGRGNSQTAVAEREHAASPVPQGHLASLDSFVCGDAFEFLRSLPAESVDLVITDPPYESLELHRSKGTTTRLVGSWFSVVPDSALPELLAEVHRVLKPNRHFYLFCDEFTADVIKTQQGVNAARENDGARACKCGLRYWREVLWVKTTKDSLRVRGGMGYHYRAASERIMFFEKGKRKLNDLGIPDALLAPRPDYKAPAGKPLQIVSTLITQSTDEGQLVIDPFAGSGVVGVAAKGANRHYLINDIDDSYLLPGVREAGAGPARRAEVPRTSSPQALLALLTGDDMQAIESSDVAHDLLLMGLADSAGNELLAKLRTMRPVERTALFRRHLRGTPFGKAILSASGAEVPGCVAWRRWLSR